MFSAKLQPRKVTICKTIASSCDCRTSVMRRPSAISTQMCPRRSGDASLPDGLSPSLTAAYWAIGLDTSARRTHVASELARQPTPLRVAAGRRRRCRAGCCSPAARARPAGKQAAFVAEVLRLDVAAVERSASGSVHSQRTTAPITSGGAPAFAMPNFAMSWAMRSVAISPGWTLKQRMPLSPSSTARKPATRWKAPLEMP